jgi:hypothetical protein
LSVLVVWLDEEGFSDNVEGRLALFLKYVANIGWTNGTTGTNALPDTSLVERVALVGPRTSDGLRGMLPKYEPDPYPYSFSNSYQTTQSVNSATVRTNAGTVADEIKYVLGFVDIF